MSETLHELWEELVRYAPSNNELCQIIAFIPSLRALATKLLLQQKPKKIHLLCVIEHDIDNAKEAAQKLLTLNPEPHYLVHIVSNFPDIVHLVANQLMLSIDWDNDQTGAVTEIGKLRDQDKERIFCLHHNELAQETTLSLLNKDAYNYELIDEFIFAETEEKREVIWHQLKKLTPNNFEIKLVAKHEPLWPNFWEEAKLLTMRNIIVQNIINKMITSSS